MKIEFQLIDADYIFIDDRPVIRLIGKTVEGKTVGCFYEGFYPYFYFIPSATMDVISERLKKFNSLVRKIEKVKKYYPIGYTKEKVEMVKITLKDPSKVPQVRDFVLREGLAKEVFEADILFKYRFMADKNIYGMRWYRVEGVPIKTDVLRTDISLKINSITEIENEKNIPFKVMAFDIEVASKTGMPDPKKDPIIMISFAFRPSYNGFDNLVLVAKPIPDKNKNVLVFRNENDMLKKFVEIISQYDPDIVTGYNINNFDIPYILTRLKEKKISRAIGRDPKKQASSRKLNTIYKNSIFGRVIVDVYELIKELAGRGFLKLKRYGLGDVAKVLIGDTKVDVAHSEITKYWKDEKKVGKLVEYSRKDSVLALRILLEKRLIDKYIELSRVSGLLLQDVLDTGEAARVENLLLREFNKKDYVIPEKPTERDVIKRKEMREAKGLKGAVVLDPLVGLYTTPILYLDFKSMYPSIFISFNICPTTLVLKKEDGLKTIKTPYGTEFVDPKVKKGIIPQIVEFLIKERDKVKKKMKMEKNQERRLLLDAKQEALKRMANAFYGYTGYIRARFYVLDIANAITSCGRYFIQKTKELVETRTGLKVIYGDTDSIMVKSDVEDLDEAFKKGEEIAKMINDFYQGKIKIKIEAVFKSFLIIAKKRYAGISVEKTEEGYKQKLVMKGIETVRRDWCDLTGETLMKVLDILLKEGDKQKALEYVRGVIEKLRKGEIPIEKLVITKSISKPLSEYKGIQPHIELVKKMKKRSPADAPGIGDRVGFVIVKGPELVSKRAEDPKYVVEHGLKIDSNYYIESQVLPPLERVFEVIGIRKSELKSVGRQMGLFSITNGIKKTIKESLNNFDGFVCLKCGRRYSSLPLKGKCWDCGGEVVFVSGNEKSKILSF